MAVDIKERIAKQRLGVSVIVPLLLVFLIWLLHFVAWSTEGESHYFLLIRASRGEYSSLGGL